MKYQWTAVGFLLAVVFGRARPAFLVAGILIGYAIDMGWLGRFSSSSSEKPVGDNAGKPDPYQILDIDPGASADEIEAAYRRQIAQYHPDKVAGAAREIRELADKRASEINAAYDQIQKIRGKK